MEISQLGARHAVRFIDDDGLLTDITGELRSVHEMDIVIEPANAPARHIARERIRAARRIPPQPVRPTSSIEKLQRLAARSWPGLEQERIGGWLLRAGDGHTRRANSCLPQGDPGVPLPQALDQVREYYRIRNLRPTLHVALPLEEPVESPVLEGLTQDWKILSPTLFLVADLRRLELKPRSDLSITAAPTPQWLALHRGGLPLPPAAVPVLTAVAASYGVLHHEGSPVAIARTARTDDWVGLSCLEVTPTYRRQGYGRTMTEAMLAQARTEGARFAHLQVEAANAAALELYESIGFSRHHRYHYRVEE